MKDKKYFKCTICGKLWNISVQTEKSEKDYICPHCTQKKRSYKSGNSYNSKRLNKI